MSARKSAENEIEPMNAFSSQLAAPAVAVSARSAGAPLVSLIKRFSEIKLADIH